MSHDVLQRQWHNGGSDLFCWNNSNYLLVADYHCEFPIIRKLGCLTSTTVINHLKSISEEYGIPEKLVSDNGTQYSSEEFHKFSSFYGFKHITSSAHYLQSNGFSERLSKDFYRKLSKLVLIHIYLCYVIEPHR